MLRPRAPHLLGLVTLALLAAPGCRDDLPPVEHEVTMPTPEELATARPAPIVEPEAAAETEAPPAPLPERPPADPEIARALDLIGASGVRFIDQAADADSRPSEYTAEQFAAMLRSKWDWIGYDITKLDPWLDEIASRSFKTNLPYLVVLDSGETSELRPWLQARLDASTEANP